MKTNNFLEKTFGPAGSPAGILIFIIGIITLFASLYGIILIILGAFLGFTSTSTIIDFDRKKVKASTNLLGIFRTGKWVNIEPNMKIGIKKSNKVWRTYSRSNRTLDIEEKDFRIILYSSENEHIMQLKKTGSLASANVELEILSKQLELGLISSQN